MRILVVGDLHGQGSNLEDTSEIFGLAGAILAKDPKIGMVVFLGDLLHTHDVVRQEPAFFIRSKVKNLIANRPGVVWVALAGNHDYSTPSASVPDNAVRLVLGDLVHVVDDGMSHISGFDFMPFVGDNEVFVRTCKEQQKSKILFCHQTYDGSRYENNQTAPHGVNQNLIPHELIISGHIHTKQNLKNDHNEVVYVGTPRALTSNEVNEKKYLTVFDSDTRQFELFSTDHLVKRFLSFEITQESGIQTIEQNWKNKDDVRINITGNQEFYDKVLEVNSHLVGKVQFVPNIRKELTRVLDIDSGSMNMDQALRKYVYEVIDASDELKGAVWTKLQKLMPQLGTNP